MATEVFKSNRYLDAEYSADSTPEFIEQEDPLKLWADRLMRRTKDRVVEEISYLQTEAKLLSGTFLPITLVVSAMVVFAASAHEGDPEAAKRYITPSATPTVTPTARPFYPTPRPTATALRPTQVPNKNRPFGK